MKHIGRHESHLLFLTLMALGLFGLYQTTLCPVVYLGDSGELTSAASSLGIPHNSGYPLYCLIGKLFCLFPLGNIAFRINLMSTTFAVLTICIIYGFLYKATRSKPASFSGAFVLAFVPIFWSQTVCAEVYTLHTFFVALLIRLLWWWDENRSLERLALLVFVAGLSFGNHMQTVMLAPAILWIVLSGDHRLLLHLRPLLCLLLLFTLALSVYIYLPVRTNAGAAIHWGDPDSLARFWNHVSAQAHREGYVMTGDMSGYMHRLKEILGLMLTQFGGILLLSVWGWIKLPHTRWKGFFLLLIVSDLFYSIFLNVISPKITPFGLPSGIAVCILAGLGIAHILNLLSTSKRAGKLIQTSATVGCCLIPALPLALNYHQCNQSQNYLAYEHMLNIFRTVSPGATLWLDGDNNIFPVAYGRIVEKIRQDVTLYDRHNVIFKFSSQTHPQSQEPIVSKDCKDTEGIKRSDYAYIAAFDPSTWYNSCTLYPVGILYQTRHLQASGKSPEKPWNYYTTESVYNRFYKDFMSRQVCAYFHFSLGRYMFTRGSSSQGLAHLNLASSIGYDDTSIHSDIAVFLTDRGFFDKALSELRKALVYYDDLSGVYNNWGYYYNKLADHDRAIRYYRKAIHLKPDNHGYYNNLGLAFYNAGSKKEAMRAFRKSIELKSDQPKLLKFLRTTSFRNDNVNEPKSQKQEGSGLPPVPRTCE